MGKYAPVNILLVFKAKKTTRYFDNYKPVDTDN